RDQEEPHHQRHRLGLEPAAALPMRTAERRGRARQPLVHRLEHDPEKACPGLDPGWVPVFGKDHAPPKSESGMTIEEKSSRPSAPRIVGMTNSAPSFMPEGQRAVTVLVLV